MASSDVVWKVEEIATGVLLEARINQLRHAGTGISYVFGNSTDGYTIAFLE
jgi:hypothetical protein